MTTVSAISLLPHVAVGDGRESGASASHSAIAMSSLTRQMGAVGIYASPSLMLLIDVANAVTEAAIVIIMAKPHNIFFIVSYTVPCRAQPLIVNTDCFSVYVVCIQQVIITYHFFIFPSASSARRMYDLALERALSALRRLSSALSMAALALRSALRSYSYCFWR